MNVIRYNPNRWFDMPFERIFDEFLGHAANAPAVQESWAPRVDIREEKDAVLLSAELPGVAKDDVKVELENGILTLSGEKKSEREESETGFYRSERVYGSFTRSFRVPETVDAEKIAAEYANGVLTLTLPKRPEAAARLIAVKAEDSARKKLPVS